MCIFELENYKQLFQVVKSTRSNYQDLLKAIAVVIMVTDHTGYWFFGDMHILRIIGRYGIATWCFFAGYNYSQPKSIVLKLGLLLSCITYIIQGHFMFNMLVVFYVGQWYIYLYEKYGKTSDKLAFYCIILLIIISPLTMHILEYSTLAIAFMMSGYLEARGRKGIEYLPMLGLSLMLLMYITFVGYFNSTEIAWMLFSVGVGIWAIVFKRPETPISFDVRILSRNTLWIYFWHIVLFCTIKFIDLCSALVSESQMVS
jgi:hypothetical protein